MAGILFAGTFLPLILRLLLLLRRGILLAAILLLATSGLLLLALRLLALLFLLQFFKNAFNGFAVMGGPEVAPPEIFTDAHRIRVLGA